MYIDCILQAATIAGSTPACKTRGKIARDAPIPEADDAQRDAEFSYLVMHFEFA